MLILTLALWCVELSDLMKVVVWCGDVVVWCGVVVRWYEVVTISME
jgi:hypothetical protein